ncbi:MAG TPA: ABC transporter permease, partial [Gemmatimonadaceae bacterium]|nr:ABC transporter permease [Gemmatimonadaceae bacterium]
MSILHSLQRATRRLLRAPAFTGAAVLTLTLGIGATSAAFSVVNAVLLRPLPYAEPAQLVDLSHTLAIAGVPRVDQSDATYLYYRRASRTLLDVAAYRATAVNLGPARGGGAGEASHAERVAAAGVSASAFAVLRAAPSLGRALGQADDAPDAPPVVVIGQRLWERKYGADPAIVGRRLEIDGVSREVVGVMPASFRFPAPETALWVPLGLDPANTRSAAFDYRAVARLRDGVSPQAAAVELQQLLPRVPEAFPGRLTAGAIEQTAMRAVVRPLRDVVVGDIGNVLWVVLAAVGFVLLIGCANVANLFLARAEGRQHELAVRRALGGGHDALVGEFLSEGLILAAAGGALGVAFATAAVGVLRSLGAGIGIPRLDEVSVDGAVLAVAGGVTIATALLVSVLPALRSARVELATVLAQTGRSATSGRGRIRARNALVIVQVALALMLLTGAGLMARSFAHLRSVHPGFDAPATLTFRVALPSRDYAQPGTAARFLVSAVDGIAALPGVHAVGVVTKLPLDAEARRDSALWVEDRPLPAGGMPNIHQVAFATPDYFRALGIPLVQGRAFEPPDASRMRREVIVSRALAARYWTDGRAVGRRVRMAPTGPWYTVVGVTGDVRGTGLDQPPDEMV